MLKNNRKLIQIIHILKFEPIHAWARDPDGSARAAIAYARKKAHSSGANIHVHLFARQILALYSPQGSNRSLVNIPKT